MKAWSTGRLPDMKAAKQGGRALTWAKYLSRPSSVAGPLPGRRADSLRTKRLRRPVLTLGRGGGYSG